MACVRGGCKRKAQAPRSTPRFCGGPEASRGLRAWTDRCAGPTAAEPGSAVAGIPLRGSRARATTHDVNLDLGAPLSDDDLDRLADFLDSPSVPEDAMDIVEAHGFITAIVSAPTMLMPSQWQPTLFGGQPEFQSMAEAQEILGLLMRLNNEVAGELQSRSFMPLGYPDPEDIERWCEGYLRGARLDPAWGEDEEGTALIFPVGVLAGAFDLVGEDDETGEKIVDPTKHIERCRETLPEYVQRAYDHFVALRREALARPRPAKTSKVGRNDPCPCGSGKKFKRCCLSSSTATN